MADLMGYLLSQKAEEDIIGIYLYGEEAFGGAQADAYHTKLEKCFEFLVDNPYAAAERMEIKPPVRVHPVGEHLVVYQIVGGQDVFVIRVRHSHEDWHQVAVAEWQI